jgi:glycerol-3-phosphate dehydrogenase
MYDICIIGAGITGCFLARDLSKREISVLLLEKESDVANGATMANSAIIHAGNDPKDGTLKAAMNLRGNRMYEDICKELGTAFVRTSALVAATTPEEELTLFERYETAVSRGIPAVMLSREEALSMEPNLSDLVTKALELPTTGIICPWEVTIALAEEAVQNGVDLHLEETAVGIDKNAGSDGIAISYFIHTQAATYEANCVINCAGVFADTIYAMVSDKKPVPFTITPRRGEYFVVDKLTSPVVSRVIYPVPSKVGKGILATPTVDGNLLVGPNAQNIDDCDGINTTYEGLAFIREKISKTVKNIPMNKVIRQFAGLRASGTCGGSGGIGATDDFVIEEAADARNFINIACIDSPGLTSAPAISEYVIEKFISSKFPEKMTMKKEFKHRRPTIRIQQMTAAERTKLVETDPTCGNIVCRCEQVTEGEILDVAV